jgi:hypothetical protein
MVLSLLDVADRKGHEMVKLGRAKVEAVHKTTTSTGSKQTSGHTLC